MEMLEINTEKEVVSYFLVFVNFYSTLHTLTLE